MKTLVFILLLLSPFLSISQDLIVLKDNDSLIVKIQEILSDKIKYKKLNNLNGPNYVLMKSEIYKIVLSTGEEIRLANQKTSQKSSNQKTSQKSSNPKTNKKPKSEANFYNARKNLISYNYASLIVLSLEFGYERIIDKKGYLGLKVPIMFNMGVDPDYLKRKTIFGTGIHVNIYPFSQRRVAYFTGPVFRYSILADNDQTQTSTQNNVSIDLKPTLASYFGFYMNNGVLFRASSFLSFGVSLGFGIRRDLSRPEENSQFDMIGEGSINFRF